MSSTFNKIVVASTVLAGAAVGTLTLIRNKDKLFSGKLGKGRDIDSVTDVANDILAKERNYVDLTSTSLKDSDDQTPVCAADDAQTSAGDDSEAASEESSTASPTEPAADEQSDSEDGFREGLNAESVSLKTEDPAPAVTTESEEFFDDEKAE